MRAKPDMKPWVNMYTKIRAPLGAALQREYLFYVSEVPPLWGSINVLTIITLGFAGVTPLQGSFTSSQSMSFIILMGLP